MANRRVLLGALGITAFGLGVLALWPAREEHAGYPFARRVTGSMGSPLWSLPPEALGRATADDTRRLGVLVNTLDAALELAKKERALLETDDAAKLDAGARQRVRDVWWAFMEPMIALDALKERYDGWYGVDYLSHPELHARAFALGFAALCAQAHAGHRLLDIVQDRTIAPKLFDESMPELGLPRGTFSALRRKLSRARDHSLVPVSAEWFERWIERKLESEPSVALRDLAKARSRAALAELRLRGALRTAENKADVVKGAAFQAWFPVQTRVAEWAGDTRFAPQGRRLVNDAQIEALGKALRPGDILIERRNWYLSNVGLPGFWPHAALYTGTQAEIAETFDQEPEVQARYGKLSEYLAKRHPKAWAALGTKDGEGHAQVVIEAVSEGVVATSLVHSCGADYVAAVRPKLPALQRAVALDRALGYFGRPYDFDFDFATDDQIVCSELVIKAYEPVGDGPGLRVPWIRVAGRQAVPPTEFVRLFAAEQDKPDPQLQFVAFLDGREKERRAVEADGAAFARSATRPKWDIVQP